MSSVKQTFGAELPKIVSKAMKKAFEMTEVERDVMIMFMQGINDGTITKSADGTVEIFLPMEDAQATDFNHPFTYPLHAQISKITTPPFTFPSGVYRGEEPVKSESLEAKIEQVLIEDLNNHGPVFQALEERFMLWLKSRTVKGVDKP